MNADWLGSLKPVVEALVLPPTSALALALAGAWVTRKRARTGSAVVVLACVLLWLSTCNGAAGWVERQFLAEPAPLVAAERAQLKARAASGASLAIVVLGGGMERDAQEYDDGANLSAVSLARLRYAAWLGRQTGIALAASGGHGWAGGQGDGVTEAAQMARVAQAEFGVPVRWIEAASRDTHENATNTVALLAPAGVREIVLVTHGVHMPRALREFRAAARGLATPLVVSPAAIGESWPEQSALLRWMPSGLGAARMRGVLHELLAGAASGS